MAKSTEGSPISINKNVHASAGEVFSKPQPRPSLREKITVHLKDTLQRLSHRKYDYMPVETTAGQLVEIIQGQNKALEPNHKGEIDLGQIDKKYEIAYHDTYNLANATVIMIEPENNGLIVQRIMGDEAFIMKMDKDQEVRYTVVEREKSQKSTSA